MDSKKRTQEDLEKSPASEKNVSGKSPPSKKSCVEQSPEAKLLTSGSYKPLLNSDFKIPKKVVKRCGTCSNCKQPPCFSCLNCQVNLKGKGDSPPKYTCSNKVKCLNITEENGATSPEKATGEVKAASPEKKTNNEKRSVSPEKTVTSDSIKPSPKKSTIIEQIANNATSDNSVVIKAVVSKDPSEDVDEQCPFSSKVSNKSVDGTKGKEKKNSTGESKKGHSSHVPRCGKCEGCMLKDPCLSCSACKKKGTGCSRMVCKSQLNNKSEKNKTRILILPKTTEPKSSPGQVTKIAAQGKNWTSDPKVEYQLSIGERRKLMNAGLTSPTSVEPLTITQTSNDETTPGKGKSLTEVTPVLTNPDVDIVRKGRKPETPRCGSCTGCLRTENCMDCSNCIKSGNCHKRRCLMKIREYVRKTNERKKLKMMAGSQSDSSSDLESSGNNLDNSTDFNPKMDSSLSTPIPNCGVCSNCTRKDDCGTCNKCSKGKKGCARKICRAKMREAQKRHAMKKSGGNSSQLPCGSCDGCKSSNCNECPNCLEIEKGNNTLQCFKKQCNNHNEAVLATPNFSPISSNTVATPNFSPLSSKTVETPTSKKKGYKRRKRCYVCEGCTKEPCGDCWVCRKISSGEKINEICAKKRCVNFITDKTNTPEKSKEKKSVHEKTMTPKENNSEKKKTKRTRCGECEGCNSGSCGTCVTCQKGYPQLCRAKHCTKPIITEKELAPPKEKRKRIRCGECGGCAAEPCGECNVCQKTPSLCKDRWCTNPVYRDIKKREKLGRSPGMPKPKGAGMNPRRFKRCNECNGCKAPDCGECESCEMNEKFGSEMMLGKASCEGKAPCEEPISLFQSNIKKHMAEQEDGTCPTKIIDGKLYDFRCYFCKKLPRVGSANRSELYRHYSVFHYPYELKSEFGQIKKCHHCSMDIKGGSLVSHMGQKHNEVEKYLPEAARIPLSIQKNKGRNRGHRRGAIVVYKREVSWDFPDIPEGFDPNGEIREVVDWDEESEEEKIASKWIIDGLEIQDDIDSDEEPLMVSREDPYTMTDYSGRGASCTVCKSTFAEVLQAVSHLHKVHDIKAGSPIIMLDTDRLLKGGYLNLLTGETETVVRPWKKKSVKVVDDTQGEDKPKKPTARKSTTSLPLEKGFTQIQTNVVSIPSTPDQKASEDRKAKIREAIMAVKAVTS